MRSPHRHPGPLRAAATAVLLAGLLPALLPAGAAAEPVGRQEERAAVAGRSDAALIAANPVLRRLQRDRPDLLRRVLKRLRAPVAAEARKLETPDPDPPPPKDRDGLLAENPDLGQLHRESPEAALDLIRLIREATKK